MSAGHRSPRSAAAQSDFRPVRPSALRRMSVARGKSSSARREQQLGCLSTASWLLDGRTVVGARATSSSQPVRRASSAIVSGGWSGLTERGAERAEQEGEDSSMARA